MNSLQNQNAMLLSQMAGAAKLLNAAVVENQILKAELHALDTNGTPKPVVSPAQLLHACMGCMAHCQQKLYTNGCIIGFMLGHA